MNESEFRKLVIQASLNTDLIKERIDRHSGEHREDLDKIWTELKGMRQDQNKYALEQAKEFSEQSMRITKLESERTTLGKVLHYGLPPALSIGVTGIIAYLKSGIKGG